MSKRVLLAVSGDDRLSANRVCWPAQKAMEETLTGVLSGLGYELHRIHGYDEKKQHGFIDSQRMGLDVFAGIDRDLPIIVAECVWQYSHHILPGLLKHCGPVLTLANWSGQWPGLVGMLNLNGGLTKAGRPFSTLWSENFDDPFFLSKISEWLETGTIASHDTSHVRPYDPAESPARAVATAEAIAKDLNERGAIMGVFDEGCMGMYNAIIPDELLFPLGVYKERLSQSALVAGMRKVTDAEARACYQWYLDKGFTFHFGDNPAEHLTEKQVIEQCRMYIAACRIGHSFGCDVIGIQYQQGLKDLCPASDLVEGTLNNSERPPVLAEDGTEIRPGVPFTHFNEVDECAGLDGLLTDRVHAALGQPRENTLHDVRWGDADQSGTTDTYVWVFLISGAAPPAHHVGGWAGSHGFRQPSMYFPSGGSTLHGIAKSGHVVWSRVYVKGGRLHLDIGRADAIDLPEAETRRRLEATTPQWPIMHAVLHGVSRDQMMAQHQSNHLQVAYADSAAEADLCMHAKAALAHRLGLEVHFCGV